MSSGPFAKGFAIKESADMKPREEKCDEVEKLSLGMNES